MRFPPSRLLLWTLGLSVALSVSANVDDPGDLPPDIGTATLVTIEKTTRRLTLFDRDVILATYEIALGSDPVGAKRERGDGRTPEGEYVIDYRNPQSRFHRSLHISYPSPADRAQAKTAGVEPGGAIFIHGLRNGWGWVGPMHRVTDWTDGCIAVTDEEIEEIWGAVPDGTPIRIQP